MFPLDAPETSEQPAESDEKTSHDKEKTEECKYLLNAVTYDTNLRLLF